MCSRRLPHTLSRTQYGPTLNGIFNARSGARILQVKNRLTNFKKEQWSVDDYLAELTWLAEEVREVGAALDDGELTLIGLNKLDSSYESFVIAQSAWADEVSFVEFQSMLRSHELRFVRSPATGMISMTNVVHSYTLVCQICLKKGHTVIACFSCNNESRFPTVVEKKSRFRPHQGQKQNNTVNAVWYPDSGATDHVSPHASGIQKKNSTIHNKIITANGNEGFCFKYW